MNWFVPFSCCTSIAQVRRSRRGLLLDLDPCVSLRRSFTVFFCAAVAQDHHSTAEKPFRCSPSVAGTKKSLLRRSHYPCFCTRHDVRRCHVRLCAGLDSLSSALRGVVAFVFGENRGKTFGFLMRSATRPRYFTHARSHHTAVGKGVRRWAATHSCTRQLGNSQLASSISSSHSHLAVLTHFAPALAMTWKMLWPRVQLLHCKKTGLLIIKGGQFVLCTL